MRQFKLSSTLRKSNRDNHMGSLFPFMNKKLKRPVAMISKQGLQTSRERLQRAPDTCSRHSVCPMKRAASSGLLSLPLPVKRIYNQEHHRVTEAVACYCNTSSRSLHPVAFHTMLKLRTASMSRKNIYIE